LPVKKHLSLRGFTIPKKLFLLFLFPLFIGFFLLFLKKPDQKPIQPSFILPSVTQPPLPKSKLIKTTFVEQAPEKNWDQPWQDACEEAALLTLDFYYKNQKPSKDEIVQSILSMIDYEKQQNFTKDVNLEQMAKIAKDYLNYQTEIINNPAIDQIKNYISQNIPIIVPANGKTLFKENKHFNNGGPYYHSLVILGYNDKTQEFTVHDVGTRHGTYFKYSYSLLMESIHDFPTSGKKEDINSGDKKILIIFPPSS